MNVHIIPKLQLIPWLHQSKVIVLPPPYIFIHFVFHDSYSPPCFVRFAFSVLYYFSSPKSNVFVTLFFLNKLTIKTLTITHITDVNMLLNANESFPKHFV